MEDHNKMSFTQILVEVEVEVEIEVEIEVELKVEVVEPHFKVDTEACMVHIINMKVSFMEVGEETLEEREIVKVVVEIIKVNNKTMIQTTTIVGNLST
jgi:hypothetical protein